MSLLDVKVPNGRTRPLSKKEQKKWLRKMRFDLRSPCDDCPFSKNAPMHSGIIADVMTYLQLMLRGTLVHSCHKTDRYADCEESKRSPESAGLQHCAGAMIMSWKAELPQVFLLQALLKGKLKVERLNMEAPVFDGAASALRHYLPGMAKFAKDPEQKKTIELFAERCGEPGVEGIVRNAIAGETL